MASIELCPIGGIIFVESDENPAELFPGTTWEELINELYITSETEQQIDDEGNPVLPYTKPRTWRRLS